VTSPHRPAGQAGLRDVLLLASAVGLTTGALEVASRLIRARLLQHWAAIDVTNAEWLGPVGAVVSCLLVGSVWWLAGSLRPSFRRLHLLAGVLVTVGMFDWLLVFNAYIRSSALLVLALGVATRVAALIRDRDDSARAIARRAVPLMLGVCALLAGGVRIADRRALTPSAGAARPGPNVLLLILDTVRGLDLSLYGFRLTTSPALDRLARGGVTFDRAVAPTSWSLPSHASLMTGLPAHRLTADWGVPLDRRARTLARVFAEAGYATGGFVGNLPYTQRKTGLDAGFARYADGTVSVRALVLSSPLLELVAGLAPVRLLMGSRQLAPRVEAADVRSAFRAWIEETPRDRPFFAFVNFFGAHDPYESSDSLRARFGAPARDGTFGLSWSKGRPSLATMWRDSARLRPLYDASIAAQDVEVAGVLEDLGHRGVLDNTIIVVTSDHGEEFDEHGLRGHSMSLYWTAIQVPLVIAAPGRVPAGRRVTASADLANVAATILELAGLADPGIGGRSLSRLWKAADPGDTVISLLTRARDPAARAWSAVADDVHYLRQWDGEVRLFDVARDPFEQTDLAADPSYAPARAALARAVELARRQGMGGVGPPSPTSGP